MSFKIILDDGTEHITDGLLPLTTDKGQVAIPNVGSYVALNRYQDVKTNGFKDINLAIFLAWLISEGHEAKTKNTMKITQDNHKTLSYIKKHLAFLLKKQKISAKIYIREYGDRCPYLEVGNKYFSHYLDSIGYKRQQLSATKEIPDIIKYAEDIVVLEFLRHFMSAEGCVTKRGSVEVTSASRQVMDTLSFMFRRFGIWLRVRDKWCSATNGKNIKKLYHVGIISGESVELYKAYIGFFDRAKQSKLEDCLPRLFNTNIDIVPVSDVLKEIYSKTKIPFKHLGMFSHQAYGEENVSSKKLKEIIEKMEHVLSGNGYKDLINNTRYQKKSSKEAYEGLDKKWLRTKIDRLKYLGNEKFIWAKVKSVKRV